LGTVTVTGHQLSVKLHNNANGAVVADAVRILKIITTSQSGSTEWQSTLFASQLHAAPDGLPLPNGTDGIPSPISNDQQRSEAFRLALSSDAIELKEELLSDVLDLLAITRHSQSGNDPSGLDTSHDLALCSMIQPLI
jgi:hypothetical protein